MFRYSNFTCEASFNLDVNHRFTKYLYCLTTKSHSKENIEWCKAGTTRHFGNNGRCIREKGRLFTNDGLCIITWTHHFAMERRLTNLFSIISKIIRDWQILFPIISWWNGDLFDGTQIFMIERRSRLSSKHGDADLADFRN